ncbi:hypothetical protein E4U55_006843 [Claviceps digitariae]|nr:hypothetical protein E4U55_006843 [Claviceps digitariae]
MAGSMAGFAASTDGHGHRHGLGLASGGASLPQGPPQRLRAPLSSDNTTNDTHMYSHGALGKRKADTQDNERLSKRLSLLNIERNGTKLYVPVETPSSASAFARAHPHPHAHAPAAAPPLFSPPNTHAPTPAPAPASTPTPSAPAARFSPDDSMQLDDTKHKVYIYNLDDELTSDNSEDEDTNGKLMFLPDIEKHLRQNRIPPHVLANKDGQLAGMQLVLYSDPKSLSVPEDKDGVRKAILEARQRTREKQRREREEPPPLVPFIGSCSTDMTHHDDADGDAGGDEMDLD